MKNLFEQAVTALLEGKFICKITEPDLHNYLIDEEHFHQISSFILKIGRSLKCSGSEGSYYAAYTEVNSSNKAAIAKDIELIRHNLKPTIESIRLVLDGIRSDTGLHEGQEIYAASIENYAEAHDSTKERFKLLSQQSLVKRGAKIKENVHDQIMLVLGFLEREGYLIQPNKNRNIFLVTGKISYLMEMLEFINEHEQIIEKVREESNRQGDLF
ncbi:condensin complex protein MksE [Vibrio owensii]|uniref:condensin complex protein MksE n=1 Tax=Vibrio harveyi group TaxID=717610 RepID=UPI003CC6609E